MAKRNDVERTASDGAGAGADGQAEKLPEVARPKSADIASRGLNTAANMTSFMSALIDDTLNDRVEVNKTNACCNAAGKLLKTVELQFKYGRGSVQPPPERPSPTDPKPPGLSLVG